ncbi:MAG TPA: hypothetical protein VMK05_11015, partial [Burkholderiales bacterium]|nr:hypothetical protein [Burkholderiales bacterium]
LALLALCGPAAVHAADALTIARVLGEDIGSGQLGDATDADSRARALAGIVYQRIGAAYVTREGLAATPTEIDDLAAYDARFRRNDRAQRARKLDELRAKLASSGLSAAERTRTEDFRATLERLAQQDADDDAQPAPAPAALRAAYAAQVERWKLAAALQRRYGGVVGLSEGGIYPHGALAHLYRDAAAKGELLILDAELEQRFWQIVEGPPQRSMPPELADFTPYWQRPIPSSYY